MSQKPAANKEEQHIGAHIREYVVPQGMSVTKAAKLLGVGRPALSNLLNGNASLSPEMAKKLELTFKVNAESLLRQQASWGAMVSGLQDIAETSKVFVPDFLNFTSKDIEDWGKDRIATSSRLAVFIRRLVNSTVDHISEIDFPANDDSQRRGWDGYTEVQTGNPWVPRGKAGWEFGTSKKPKTKANKDYSKSLKLRKAQRMDTTFVFVTTMRWAGKKDWAAERGREGKWKDVRAYDASDLEQWMEQSIPVQVWFSNETRRSSKGTLTLDAYWKTWSADCDPPLVHSLFAEALEGNTAEKIKEKIEKNGSVTVAADSREEGLAFIDAAFHRNEGLRNLRCRAVLFKEPGVLPGLAARNFGVIPIVYSPDVEQELAPLKGSIPSIVVQPKDICGLKPDFALSTLGHAAFNTALAEMGLNRDEVDRLSHESGRSITVLRRRLSNTAAIRTPNWSKDTRLARLLVPIALAGSWDSRSQTDKDVLQMIRDTSDYNEIEGELLELQNLEDPPVWSVDSYCGVVSKIDALFAICKKITSTELKHFLEIAELVLSEDDPALDLPDQERWMANIRGKKREISEPLRKGISETLVLLAVYSNELFSDRLGFDPAEHVGTLVRNLLTPLTGRLLEAQSYDLPMYAEAAPDELLDILEDDLNQTQPAAFEVVRPAGNVLLGPNPRTGLLWALENMAWSSERLIRVVGVLARLSERKLDDNRLNKPINTLGSLFRCWLPQTSASIEGRIAALEYLVERYPKLAWSICVEQFEPGPSSASPNHRPRWRPDARGSGDGVPSNERNQMSRRALDLALGWAEHTKETLGDLVRCVGSLPDEDQQTVWTDKDQQTVWKLVDDWSKSASGEEKASLRETVRRFATTKRVRRPRTNNKKPNQNAKMLKAAKHAYNALRPSDIVQQHSWLFLNDFVVWSADEQYGDKYAVISEARNARIADKRRNAIAQVHALEKNSGLIRLAHVGEGGSKVGWFAAQVLGSTEARLELVCEVLKNGQMTRANQERNLLSGLIRGTKQAGGLTALLKAMGTTLDRILLQEMVLLAPFESQIWNFVNTLGDDISQYYWKNVDVDFLREQREELNYAVNRLLEVGRPRATFNLISLNLSEIPSKTIYHILIDTYSSEERPPNHTNQQEEYVIKMAVKHLDQSGEFSINDMASLEFRYLTLLRREDGAIPNLELQINDNPEMFAQAVAFVFMRSDDKEDPKELMAVNESEKKNRAEQAYHLLNQLKKIPGQDVDGKLDGKRLVTWINAVRSSLRTWARSDVGDMRIGQLLAKAPDGEDGVWPCEPVRDAMEKTLNEDMGNGFRIGKFNLRGVRIGVRGDGGNQERDLAKRYDEWANTISFTHPKVARELQKIRDRYLAHAKHRDTEADKMKRLPH